VVGIEFTTEHKVDESVIKLVQGMHLWDIL